MTLFHLKNVIKSITLIVPAHPFPSLKLILSRSINTLATVVKSAVRHQVMFYVCRGFHGVTYIYGECLMDEALHFRYKLRM